MTVERQTEDMAQAGGFEPEAGGVAEGEAFASAESGFAEMDAEKGRRTAQLLQELRDRQAGEAHEWAEDPGEEAEEGEAEFGAETELFGESAEGESSTAPETPDGEHPALEGLPRAVDEEGNEWVQFEGAWVAPEFVTELYEQGQRLVQEEDEEAAWREEQEALLGEFEQAAVDLLSDTRRRSFPEMTEEQGTLLDELLLPYADQLLARLDWEGLDEDGLLSQIEEVGQTLMGRVRDLFTLAATEQARDNTQYLEAHRVRPDGTPGSPVPEGADMESYLQLPGEKRRGIMRRAAEAANALRGRG